MEGSRNVRGDVEGALRGFKAALGEEWVLTAPEHLANYRDPFAFDDLLEHLPAAVIEPATVEEVQAVLRVANEHRVAVWPISRGRNLGYGGGAPRQADAIVIDLHRMRRIIEVNDQLGYALVEPGVTFFDLYEYIRAHDLKVWLSVPGLGWGSVIGNALERGVGYTAYGEHWNNACGLEVVLPDGEVIRTGMGAMEKSTGWQLYKPGFGPAADGLFFQSNLGIVTKMGVHLAPRPECFLPCSYQIHNEDSLGPLVDILQPMRLAGVIDSTTVISSAIHAAAKLSTRKTWWEGEGAIPDDIIANQLIPKLGIGWWQLNFALYGPEAVVDAKFGIIEKAMEAIPHTKLPMPKYPGDVSEAELAPPHKIRAGVPNLMAFESTKWGGGRGGTIAFAPISPFTSQDAVKQYKMARRLGREAGFDYYGSFNSYARHMTHVYQIFFDSGSERDRAAIRKMLPLMVKEAAAEGYFEYRAHLAFMDMIADQLDFNDGALNRFNRRLKDALDPRGILAPGKQGIWPSQS